MNRLSQYSRSKPPANLANRFLKVHVTRPAISRTVKKLASLLIFDFSSTSPPPDHSQIDSFPTTRTSSAHVSICNYSNTFSYPPAFSHTAYVRPENTASFALFSHAREILGAFPIARSQRPVERASNPSSRRNGHHIPCPKPRTVREPQCLPTRVSFSFGSGRQNKDGIERHQWWSRQFSPLLSSESTPTPLTNPTHHHILKFNRPALIPTLDPTLDTNWIILKDHNGI